jgi:hypothetical protein
VGDYGGLFPFRDVLDRMRFLLTTAAFVLVAGIAAAQEPSALDARVHGFKLPQQLPTCGLEAALLLVAKETGVHMGFERTTDCDGRKAMGFPEAYKPLDLSNAAVLDGMPVKDVLARIAALAPDYDWAIMEGVAVFRPSGAWSDPTSPLAARVPAIRFSDAPLGRVMSTILNLPRPAGPGQIVSIDFQGGTVLEALNALVRSEAAMWYVSSDGQRLFVSVMQRTGGRGFGLSAPVSGLISRRPSSF